MVDTKKSAPPYQYRDPSCWMYDTSHVHVLGLGCINHDVADLKKVALAIHQTKAEHLL